MDKSKNIDWINVLKVLLIGLIGFLMGVGVTMYSVIKVKFL